MQDWRGRRGANPRLIPPAPGGALIAPRFTGIGSLVGYWIVLGSALIVRGDDFDLTIPLLLAILGAAGGAIAAARLIRS